MRIHVSTDKCIASGMCNLTCPELFAQSDADGSVEILNPHPPLAYLQKVNEVVKNCPAVVFTIENEADTSEMVVVAEGE